MNTKSKQCGLIIALLCSLSGCGSYNTKANSVSWIEPLDYDSAPTRHEQAGHIAKLAARLEEIKKTKAGLTAEQKQIELILAKARVHLYSKSDRRSANNGFIQRLDDGMGLGSAIELERLETKRAIASLKDSNKSSKGNIRHESRISNLSRPSSTGGQTTKIGQLQGRRGNKRWDVYFNFNNKNSVDQTERFLSAHGITDKFVRFNPSTREWSIYVGSYSYAKNAESRKREITDKIGLSPTIKARITGTS